MSIRVRWQNSSVKPDHVTLNVQQNQRLSTENFVEHTVNATSLTESEVRGVLRQLQSYLVRELAAGNTVDIEELGIWSVSIPGSWPKSEASNIHIAAGKTPVRVNFRPKPVFSQKVSGQATFELEGALQREPSIENVVFANTGERNVWEAGQSLFVYGEDIKFDPSDPEQGVFLRLPDGSERRIDNYPINHGGRCLFLVPQDLEGTGSLRLKLCIRYRRSKSSPPGSLRETLYQIPLQES